MWLLSFNLLKKIKIIVKWSIDHDNWLLIESIGNLVNRSKPYFSVFFSCVKLVRFGSYKNWILSQPHLCWNQLLYSEDKQTSILIKNQIEFVRRAIKNFLFVFKPPDVLNGNRLQVYGHAMLS